MYILNILNAMGDWLIQIDRWSLKSKLASGTILSSVSIRFDSFIFIRTHISNIKHTHLITSPKIQNINEWKAARLYRKSLKVLSSWAIDREIFLTEAELLRARFDAERGCSAAKATRLLKVRMFMHMTTKYVDTYILFVWSLSIYLSIYTYAIQTCI